jgi:hypothetical protein
VQHELLCGLCGLWDVPTLPAPHASGIQACCRPAAGAPVTLLCAGDFDSDGLLRVVARSLASPPSSPLPSLFWAAGFSFSRAALLQEVGGPELRQTALCSVPLRTILVCST